MLFQVTFQNVHHAVLIADHGNGKDITERWREILDSLALLFLKNAQLLIDRSLDTGHNLNAQAEESDEVDESTESQDGNVLALVCHLNHVRDDQLGHDLEDNVACELLCRAALRNEA